MKTKLLKSCLSAFLATTAFAASQNVYAQEEPADTAWEAFTLLLETPHPYQVHREFEVPVKITGAKRLRFLFSRIDVEKGYDYVKIFDANHNEVDSVTGASQNYVSAVVEGDSAFVSLEQDSSGNAWGLRVEAVQAQF